MKKDLFTTTLLAWLMCLLMPAGVMAQTKVNGLWYNFYESAKTATVVQYQGTKYTGKITIPSIVKYGGVTYSVTSIGSTAFLGCSSLTSVTIPEGVTTIGSTAFNGCSGLTSVTIPETVTGIGMSAFHGCSGLTSITIPEGVTSIGSYAFSNCSGLTSITIPRSVKSIGNGAFSYCSGLTSIIVENGNSVYDSREKCNAIIKTSTNELIAGCKNTVIPEGVTSIEDDAFAGCSGLTSITIPSSVTSIGSSVFDGTPFYNNQPDGLVYVGNVAYKYKGTMPANTSISLKEGTVGIARSAFNGCSGLTSVTIPETVTGIGMSAFENCSALTSITIPEGVTTIGGSAFRGCTSMTSITIPEGVTSIGDYAFSGCIGLTSITIPSSVTSIGSSVFDGTPFYNNQPDGLVYVGNVAYKYKGTMPANTSISLKEGTVGIAVNAFYGCSSLTSVTIPEGVTSIGTNAFLGCSSLTSVTIPKGVMSIESSAFQSCSSLTSITIPKSVVSIGDYAFSSCRGLTSVTIPESVTIIGQGAFSGCTGLTSITIPEGVTSIGNVAFNDCSGLTSITIPESVKSIDNYAFSYCSGLPSITIPASVTSIGIGAFNGCSGLTAVTVKNPTPVTLSNRYTFSNRANATLYVPAGCKAAYEVADVWKDFKEIVEMAPEEPAYPEIEDFAVVLDGERQTLHGRMVAQEGEEYIVTDAGVYRVTGRRERLAGDVNDDGKITIADVTGLVNVILGHAHAESATIYDVERAEE